MKRSLLFLLTAILVLFTACSSGGQTAEETGPESPAPGEIWQASETPKSFRYDRMWFESAYAECDDQDMIEAVVDAIKDLKVGKATDMVTDDYTDILTFTFEDGSTVRLEFENQCWVTEDGTRYEVEGLKRLRDLLEQLIDDAV